MARRLRIRTALFVVALAAGAAVAGFATAPGSASHATVTAGGMGPHSIGVIQPDPIIIIDR